MSHSRLLVVLLAALLIGGVGAWVVVEGGGESEVAPADFDELSVTEEAANAETELENVAPNKREEPELLTLDETETAKGETETGTGRDGEVIERGGSAGDSNGPGNQQGGNSSRSTPAGQGDTGRSTPRATPRTQNPDRKLTPAEREEKRRNERGRPALRKRLDRTPAAVSSTNALKKTPEQEKWEEQWYSEGFTPPEMVSTPVRGKIMSEQAREGLAEATVGLISFFPLDGVAGGPLLPVITELTTDENGFFKGDIPASELAPLNYPRVALAITWETHRIVTAIPVESLVVGQQNELGIFWAPELPYQLEIDATQFEGSLSVVSTGELDPQRWHEAKRAEILSYFPSASVAVEDPEGEATGPAKGHAMLIATWDGIDAPYISLLDGQSILQTRKPARATIISNKGGDTVPQPFNELVFENDTFTPISGQVLDADGAGLANAVITTIGGELSQTIVTDAAGWFFIEDPPEQTHSLHCVHDNWVETRVNPVKPGDSDVVITLEVERPVIPLYVTDKLTQAPITELSIAITGLVPWGADKGNELPVAFTELTSSDGNFLLEWEYEISEITVEKLGYFPRTIEDPYMEYLDTVEQKLSIELSPGRKLEVRPRDYTNVEREDRWFPDSKPESPGIYTAWAHHWIEYEVDFGEAPEEGEEGGSFDIILGCTNKGIVDNEYEFQVDVFVDGEKKGTLTMIADSLHEQLDRMSLGKLDGVHNIRLVWTNDKWIPEQLDANIRYQSLKFIEQP